MRFDKKHSLSSQLWLKRQAKDRYTIGAKEQGYFSRAAFKLIAIQKKYRIFKTGQYVLDLGSAPGSWTQVALEYTANEAFDNVVGIDLLETNEISGAIGLIADIFAENINDIIKQHLPNSKCNVVLSDMAPNTTGDRGVDHLRIINLCEAADDIADSFLSKGGHMVLKIFHGSEEEAFVRKLRQKYQKVVYFKPEASRKSSNEIYLVCLNKQS
ncbi:MAG: RlmE family RNA methyltransferase [Rickettsiaceae bacterium]|nr:RlmE family RNA methyltransferase [Rickettsiaceae bacterium]